MGQWSKRPVDLLNVIEDNLVLYVDKVRIRAVCEVWNSYLPKLPNHQVKQLPWLLHPLKNNTEASHGLFNPIDKKVYEIYLPEAHEKFFKGSSYGWLVTVEDRHSSSPTDMYLINPLTRARITLPPRTEFADVVQYRPNEVNEEFIVRMAYDVPDHFYGSDDEESVDELIMRSYTVHQGLTVKIVLSSPPCDGCVVVAIYGQFSQLAWCRFNDGKWTHIYASICGIIDIMFHKGKLHALTQLGKIFMFENIGTGLDTKMTEIVSGVPIPLGQTAYLAECSNGNLIVVGRHFEVRHSFESSLQTKGFTVYKVDKLNSSWVEVKNIGDDILILGFNSSFSISSHDLPGHKGNNIYFSDSTDEMKSYDLDMGVFDLEDEVLELLPGFRQPIWPRPIWINIG